MLNGLYEQAEDILVGCVIDGVLYGDTTVTGIEEVNVLPEKFILYQNYPNPFNPNTNILFSIKENGFISLKIYDVLGKEVATLVNEQRSAGNYEVEFDASTLPSGMYIYKIQSGNFIDSKKMLLLK